MPSILDPAFPPEHGNVSKVGLRTALGAIRGELDHGGFIRVAEGGAERKASERARETVSVRDFGARGDGETDDGPAIEQAQKYLLERGGGSLVYPDGRYAVTRPIHCRNNVAHTGLGLGSVIVSRRGDRKTPFMNDVFLIGIHTVNSLPHYEGNPLAPISAGDRVLELRSEEGRGLDEGGIYLLRSKDAVRSNAGDEFPISQTFVKIENIDRRRGTLTIEMPLDEAVAEPILMKMTRRNSIIGLPNHVAEDVTIRDLRLENGSINASAGYRCLIDNLRIDRCRNLIAFNCLAHSRVSRLSGTFYNRFIEIKLGSHDSVYSDIDGAYFKRADVPDATGPISIGECCRNIELRNVRGNMGEHTGGFAIGVQYARNITMRNVEVDGPRMKGPALALVAGGDGASRSVENCRFQDVRVRLSSGSMTLGIGSGDPTAQPRNNTLRGCSLTTVDGTATARINGGSENRIEGCDLGDADLYIAAKATRNSLTGCRLGSLATEAGGMVENQIGDNVPAAAPRLRQGVAAASKAVKVEAETGDSEPAAAIGRFLRVGSAVGAVAIANVTGYGSKARVEARLGKRTLAAMELPQPAAKGGLTLKLAITADRLDGKSAWLETSWLAGAGSPRTGIATVSLTELGRDDAGVALVVAGDDSEKALEAVRWRVSGGSAGSPRA